MNWYTQKVSKDKKKETAPKLTFLDKVILEKCEFGARIQMILHGCKPYYDDGDRQYATTEEVKRSVLRLEQMGLLVRRR